MFLAGLWHNLAVPGVAIKMVTGLPATVPLASSAMPYLARLIMEYIRILDSQYKFMKGGIRRHGFYIK